jgi:hypothetical protein
VWYIYLLFALPHTLAASNALKFKMYIEMEVVSVKFWLLSLYLSGETEKTLKNARKGS